MDKRARAKLQLDERKVPHWSFTGFRTPDLTDDDVVRTWLEYRDHHVLLHAGGYLDQPPEWWADIETCEMMYLTREIVNEPEWERKREAEAKQRGARG